MGFIGFYYLHDNGQLIYKSDLNGENNVKRDLLESDLVKDFWPIDNTNRESAWSLLINALAAGADRGTVHTLAVLWDCNDKDAQELAQRIPASLLRDGDQWCATRTDFENLQLSPAGFGTTCLDAMAELCKELGYRSDKTKPVGFIDLLRLTIPKTQ